MQIRHPSNRYTYGNGEPGPLGRPPEGGGGGGSAERTRLLWGTPFLWDRKRWMRAMPSPQATCSTSHGNPIASAGSTSASCSSTNASSSRCRAPRGANPPWEPSDGHATYPPSAAWQETLADGMCLRQLSTREQGVDACKREDTGSFESIPGSTGRTSCVAGVDSLLRLRECEQWCCLRRPLQVAATLGPAAAARGPSHLVRGSQKQRKDTEPRSSGHPRTAGGVPGSRYAKARHGGSTHVCVTQHGAERSTQAGHCVAEHQKWQGTGHDKQTPRGP